MLATLLAIIAVVIAYRAASTAGALQLRIGELEATIASLRQEIGWLRTAPPTPPETGAPSQAQPPARAAAQRPPPQPPRPQTPREMMAAAERAAPKSVPPVAGAKAASASWRNMSPTPASPESFEQALGTRWTVWAGGLALALGGLLLVRYSIEAGLIGPGVRIVLGLLLAAALVAGGEWTRRNDTPMPIDAIPRAHIPSILTAAGTVVAFGNHLCRARALRFHRSGIRVHRAWRDRHSRDAGGGRSTARHSQE